MLHSSISRVLTSNSATVDGDVLVWDISVSDSEEEWEIKAVKALRLHNSAIRVLSVTNMYIVTGGDEGTNPVLQYLRL